MTLLDKKLPAGEHNVTFNASNFPNGIYFYRMQAGKFSDVKKWCLHDSVLFGDIFSPGNMAIDRLIIIKEPGDQVSFVYLNVEFKMKK